MCKNNWEYRVLKLDSFPVKREVVFNALRSRLLWVNIMKFYAQKRSSAEGFILFFKTLIYSQFSSIKYDAIATLSTICRKYLAWCCIPQRQCRQREHNVETPFPIFRSIFKTLYDKWQNSTPTFVEKPKHENENNTYPQVGTEHTTVALQSA